MPPGPARGQADQRSRGHLLHREGDRVEGQILFVDPDNLRERADPVLVGTHIDFVADLEALEAGPDPDHDPGQIVVQNHGEPERQGPSEFSVPDVRIEHINAGRTDPDQNLPVLLGRLWTGGVPRAQSVLHRSNAKALIMILPQAARLGAVPPGRPKTRTGAGPPRNAGGVRSSGDQCCGRVTV